MISLNKLGVTYPNGTEALHNISIELNQGEFTVILGSSGAGKSTLLRCINFLTYPTSGKVIIEGNGDLNHPKILQKHRQRTGIARALAQKPKFILADEPIASLDPASSHQVLSNLQKICQEDRIGALISLHQVDLALQYAQRIIGLGKGTILFDCNPSEIKKQQLEEIYQTLSYNPISKTI
mgnify:CR=1 FL=1